MSARELQAPTGQAGLDLPQPPLTWERLVRGAGNETALALAGRPGAWALPALCIIGPPRCGLTTLARLAADRHGGQAFAPADLQRLGRKAITAAAHAFAAVDDADIASGQAPEPLLSLLNSAAAAGGHVLLTAHTVPSRWVTQSADLRSRLKALPVAEIDPPGEALARDWLSAAAAQRYMRLSQETLNYLVPRLDLHYEAAESLVQRLSDAVTRSGRPPGIALARQVLDGIEDSGDGDFPDGPDEG